MSMGTVKVRVHMDAHGVYVHCYGYVYRPAIGNDCPFRLNHSLRAYSPACKTGERARVMLYERYARHNAQEWRRHGYFDPNLKDQAFEL